MKQISVFLLSLLVLSFMMACGGGGEKMEEEMAAEDTEMMAPEGYEVMDVTNGGSITGKVSYAGAVPEKMKLEITKDVAVCGKETHYKEDLVVSGDKGLANVVVRITNISSGKGMDSMGESFQLDQNGCAFKPHISVVPAGAELVILNSDGVLHNIHTYSEANAPVNVAQPGFKKRMVQTFNEAEVIRVACDVHNWMSGYIVVTDNPYCSVSGADGSFELGNVPAGTYQVEFWHETLGTKSMEVTVAAGAAADASVEFAAGT